MFVRVRPEDERTRETAKGLAKGMDIHLYDLVWRALEDYITLHQPVTVRETRSHTTAPDYTRQRRTNGL